MFYKLKSYQIYATNMENMESDDEKIIEYRKKLKNEIGWKHKISLNIEQYYEILYLLLNSF